MNIFFTCKNTLLILLQLYRLLILCLETRPVYRRQSRLFSLIPVNMDSENPRPLHTEIEKAKKDAKSKEEAKDCLENTMEPEPGHHHPKKSQRKCKKRYLIFRFPLYFRKPEAEIEIFTSF